MTSLIFWWLGNWSAAGGRKGVRSLSADHRVAILMTSIRDLQRNLIYLLYRLVQAVAFPLILAYLLLRVFRDRAYFRHINDRFGWLPHSFEGTAHGAIWLHAVSVGEVMTSVGLLDRLRQQYPSRRLFVSSTTLAGRALAEEKLAGLVDGVFYAPIDYCFAVRGVLRCLRPSVVVVLETEIWPNLYREVKRTGAALIVVNGRISDRAMPRNRRVRWLFRAALSWPDVILAQSEVAADRYRELGAPAGKVRISGNLKYDFDPTIAVVTEPMKHLVDRTRPDSVWIAASTMPPREAGDVDEDDVVIAAFQRLAATRKRLLLVLVPRRPGRFDEAAEKLRLAGVPFLRRSGLAGDEDLSLPGAVLVDSIGELTGLFGLADVVFMGGSLARRGGHNILEPAFYGRPVIVGPHMENFPAIAHEFRAGGGLHEISSADELAGAVGRLLDDPALRQKLGGDARRLAEAKRGATEEALREIQRLSDYALARQVDPILVEMLLWPLARLWEIGWRLKKSRAIARRRWLDAPVISIGGLGMGGIGKTPCVLHVAERLKEWGEAPAILTRGYRRLSPEKATILEPGAPVAPRLTGDEAQLFLRAAVAPVGIGADRYTTGSRLAQSFSCNVFLLDDGFQHWRLGRDLDIVLIDALDPASGGDLFPLGRLREPLRAIARADVILLTRCDPGRPLAGIKAMLRKYNPSAPVFQSQVVPREWVDLESGQRTPPGAIGDARAAAFCGLANPASFRQTLSSLGITPVAWWEFSDHHLYRPWELRQLARRAKVAGAEVLLTTEKDLMNLPEGAAGLLNSLPLRWLRIGMEIERDGEFLEIIRRHVRLPVAVRSESGDH